MRPFRNLIAGFVGLTIVTAIGSAIAALIARDRLVSRGGDTDDDIDLVTIFNGREFASKAAGFRGGSILTWYGGATVDLRDATLDPAGATLTSRTIFGGLQLVVPETWQVTTSVTAVFGGVADTRDHSRVIPDGPVLVLGGLALFGGVQVTSEAARYGEALDEVPVAGAAPA
jgi:hypothetical protein